MGMIGCGVGLRCRLSAPCKRFPVLVVSVACAVVRVGVYFLSGAVMIVLSRMGILVRILSVRRALLLK